MPEAAALRRAKGYPYRIDRRSFRYVDGEVRPESRSCHPDRVPVIAFGSNRSAEQLARKYRGWPAGTEIPVSLAWLGGHDVVYSAHFARYGAVPAMLFPVGAVTVEVSVTWLTEPQLRRMHQTEGASNYRFEMRDGLDLRFEDGARIAQAGLYFGLHGAFAHQGGPVPLSDVAAEGRESTGAGSGVGQVEVLTMARDRLAPDASLDAFILQNIACPVTRAERGRRLRRDALAVEGY